MPFQVGSVAVHDDGQHFGSSKRDVSDGVAGIGPGGNVLAPGPDLELTRDGSENIEVIERTSGNIVFRWTRIGVNDFECRINCGGVACIMQNDSMKDVVNGIASLDGGGNVVAAGDSLVLKRNIPGLMFIEERTSTEVFVKYQRLGANDYKAELQVAGAWAMLLNETMKDAANGIAGLDASGDLNHSVYAGLLQKYHISDDVLHTHDGSAGTNSTVYVKMRTITLNALSPSPSTLRVAFCLRTTGTGFTAYGRIYKNGAPFGTEQTENSAEPCDWYSEDLSFAQGDTIELWCKISNASWYAYVDNFQVRGIEDQLLSYAILETDLGVADAFTATNS